MADTELHYTLFIATTPEKLWAAITTPEFTRQYWGGMVNAADWKTGARWQHEDTANGNSVRITGTVLECTPPERLVLSWAGPDNPAEVSHVTFTIQRARDVVRLDVVHGGLIAGSAMAGGVSRGWPLVLSSLKSWLETGKGIDIMAIFGDKSCGKSAAA